MKKIFTIISVMLLCTSSLFAQAPKRMSYQAVVRDIDGKVITNQELAVQISILQDSLEGISIYSETHTTIASTNGVINIEIGGGQTSDDFLAIDWSKGPYFIKSTTEVNGKTVSVTSQLLSVPYALYAEKVNDEYLEKKIQSVLPSSSSSKVDYSDTIDKAIKVDISEMKATWYLLSEKKYNVINSVEKDNGTFINDKLRLYENGTMDGTYSDDYNYNYMSKSYNGVWRYKDGYVFIYEESDQYLTLEGGLPVVSFNDDEFTIRRRLGDNEYGIYSDYTFKKDGSQQLEESETITTSKIKAGERYYFTNIVNNITGEMRVLSITDGIVELEIVSNVDTISSVYTMGTTSNYSSYLMLAGSDLKLVTKVKAVADAHKVIMCLADDV